MSLTAAREVGVWGREAEMTVRVTESLRKSKLGFLVISSSSLSLSGAVERWEEMEDLGGGFGVLGVGFGGRDEDE